MRTDMGSSGRGESSDSSRARNRKSNSDGSTSDLARSSARDTAAEDGGEVAPRLTSLDVLLSLLQSDLGEIQDYGGVVRFFDHPQGLIIQLPGTRLCKIHAQIHSGETCPHC